ncbi:AAA family ATPase [Clostridium estertheticum]|uniref:AAA family ATPase n=1 Tax=Clostridium estertheticum TaxID=238834 RepID=UPI001C6EF8F3|nr:AAA family ATPase [Clostridium estertheticum]MBW9151452.1 AAA family ATPase [Clostridium estertheticum]WLC83409.1 AAA family ATPase [Clostridium estertheticum]
MYHYNFTSDLRFASEDVSSFIKKRASLWIDDKVPTANEDKSLNNTCNSTGFYFNLRNKGNCAYAAANGDVQKVLMNFIKKYQIPNPGVKSFKDAKNDGIHLAPLRILLKLLYIIYLNEGENGYITKDEILNFIFYNDSVAKNQNPDFIELFNNILSYRINGTLPSTIAQEADREWKYQDRQLGIMLTLMCEAKCLVGNQNNYRIRLDTLNTQSKAAILDIIIYNDFWNGNDKNSFAKYMEIQSFEEERRMELHNEDNDRVLPRNRIIFGAPGTGKSYSLNQQIKKIIPCDEEGKVVEEYFERVTFYPSYTYSQFVGCYKPKPKKVLEKDATGVEVEKEFISYEFVPGPFARVLSKALKLKQNNVAGNCMLVIEEINRANAAAVFGDIFQLLDRKIDGNSEYEIETSEEMRTYLAKQLSKTEKECAKIIIPSNLFIWATMNSADQGVTPMDTAFKRRWDFEYIGIDAGEFSCSYLNAPIQIGEEITSWNKIRKEINRLLQSPNIKLNEDKLMGPFFLSESAFIKCKNKEVSEVKQEQTENVKVAETATNYSSASTTLIQTTIDEKIFKDAFKSKVLMYLFEDAVKSKRIQLFNTTTYSKLCEDFELRGLKIFKGIVEENLIINIPSLNDENAI